MPAVLQVDKYFQALQQLVARGAPISLDAVAKEAGSGKGSIKKSRPGYQGLISAIRQAADEQKQARICTDPTPRLRQDIAALRSRLDAALEREVCLLDEVHTLREKVRQLEMGRLTAVPEPTR